MKKATVLLTVLFLLSMIAVSQNRKIEFVEKPWKEILQMSKAQNRMIFLDAYASWCGPCKWMAKNMFTKDSVADYYNKNFVCVSMDMEKGEGLELAKKYQIRVYPTLLFLDSTGNMMHRKAGAPQQVQDYIDMGNTAMNPAARLGTYDAKYKAGDRSAAFIMQYIRMLQEAYIPYQKVLKDYFETQQEKDLTNRNNWTMISRYISDPESPQFKYLIGHREDFGRLYTSDSVNGKIVSVYESALTQLTRSGQVSDSVYQAARKRVLATGIPGTERAVFNADLNYFTTKGKTDKFLELAYNDLDKYYHDNPEMLNNIAWYFNSMAKDEKYIAKALEWSKRTTEISKNPNYLDTYAALLNKSGKKEEAILQEKAAIELAKQQGMPTEEFEARLKELEK